MSRRDRRLVAILLSLLPALLLAHRGAADETGVAEAPPVVKSPPQTTPAESTKNASDAKRYIRVKRDTRGQPLALETAVVRFVPQSSDREGLAVDLISAVHVGEEGYYNELNKRFENYDAVLYELVAPEGTVVPKGGGQRNRNMLSSLQNALKDLLELEYQLSGIDYTKKNFVHADLSPDEFSKSMKEKGESFWTIFFRLMAASMVQQSANAGKTSELDLLLALFDRDRALKLKRIMADQFSDMEILISAFNGPDGSTLITERNKAALKVLAKEIAAGRKKIAIFYGGGHMPDFEPRLAADFKLKRDNQQWLEAWNLRDQKK